MGSGKEGVRRGLEAKARGRSRTPPPLRIPEGIPHSYHRRWVISYPINLTFSFLSLHNHSCLRTNLFH